MSTLQNDMIFESINESFDIRPCFNGVGNWEVFDDTGSVHEFLIHLMKQVIVERRTCASRHGRIHYNEQRLHGKYVIQH
ncbi:MAG: hypothetical protein CM15mV20_0410 [uncultured marine virus]|nr:MAG: hypothetical protein CM15mV20_0410 [uncultured marine virus]